MSQDNEKDVKERRGGKGESAIGKPVDRWKVWKVNREDRRDTTRMKYFEYVRIYGANYENEILTRSLDITLFYLQIILRCYVTSLLLDYFWFN